MSNFRYHNSHSKSPQPVAKIYRVEKVVGELQRKTETGFWSDALPGEQPLSGDLRVSRPVLREALATLEPSS